MENGEKIIYFKANATLSFWFCASFFFFGWDSFASSPSHSSTIYAFNSFYAFNSNDHKYYSSVRFQSSGVEFEEIGDKFLLLKKKKSLFSFGCYYFGCVFLGFGFN